MARGVPGVSRTWADWRCVSAQAIRKEIRSPEPKTKAVALEKLTYLTMSGCAPVSRRVCCSSPCRGCIWGAPPASKQASYRREKSEDLSTGVTPSRTCSSPFIWGVPADFWRHWWHHRTIHVESYLIPEGPAVLVRYDMCWASFHCVEVMSQPKLALKHAGYLAVQQVRARADLSLPPRVSVR